jgi:surface polysaccharide O-acyltransferase-like enzyme
MIRPERPKPNTSFLAKFVKIFGLLMTTLYVVLGVYLIFTDEQNSNLNIPAKFRYILGGVLILYGIFRFIRVLQANSRKDRRRYEE